MSAFGSIIASLSVLGAFLLAFFGMRFIIQAKGRHLKGWLMVGAALILLMNVYLLSLPIPS